MTVEERIAELEKKEQLFRSHGMNHRADQYRDFINGLKERLDIQ